jgi:hypothetical protein
MKKVSKICVEMNATLDINCHIEGNGKDLILSICMLIDKAPMMKEILSDALEICKKAEEERERLLKQSKSN